MQSYELRKQSGAILEVAQTELRNPEVAQAKFRNPSCAIRPKSCAILVAQSGEVTESESDFIPSANPRITCLSLWDPEAASGWSESGIGLRGAENVTWLKAERRVTASLEAATLPS